MKVEILETKQTEELDEAADKERQELLTTLGFGCPQSSTNIPFPELSGAQTKAIRILYPNRVDALKYRNYIPTPVLRTIKTWSPHFKVMSICSDHDQDPVLIGEENNTSFLLARWGEDLYPLSNFLQKAVELYKAGRTRLLQSALNNVEGTCNDYFAGRHVGYISPEDY